MRQLPSTHYLFISLTLLLLSLSVKPHSLKFNLDGDFTILQFTDLHYFSDDDNDIMTQRLQIQLIQKVKPDLVIITGDAVQGAVAATNPGGFEKSWRRFTKPMTDAKIPYAYILGNHDAEGDLDRLQIVKLDQTNPWSVKQDSEGIPGTTNFMIPIFSSRNQYELAANLWMFDSGSTGCDGFSSSWGCVERYQLDWYSEESDRIREMYGENIHQLAFLHIPIPEYLDMYNDEKFYGEKEDTMGCPYVNTGFFDLVKEEGDISGIFAGHDHTNNFGGWYQDVELVYGIKAGYNTYGEKRGCRVIKLKETYNEQGELNVTRSHFALFENGTVEEPNKMKAREGPRIDACNYPGSRSRWYVNLKKWFYNFKKWLSS